MALGLPGLSPPSPSSFPHLLPSLFWDLSCLVHPVSAHAVFLTSRMPSPTPHAGDAGDVLLTSPMAPHSLLPLRHDSGPLVLHPGWTGLSAEETMALEDGAEPWLGTRLDVP